MKATLVICFLICLLFTNCVQQVKNPLEGSWQLLSGKTLTKDTIINYPLSINGNHMKIIGKKYFSTIWQDTTLNKSDWWFAGFNGGIYTFENGIYTEQEMYFSLPSNIGNKVAFKAEINNDILVLTFIPEKRTDENVESIEKWKRLE